ncbi:MAG: flavin reductase family protein [Clostridia bacterium]|nr:flavin reductase family protein [Clostridia bacterium]
MKKEIGAAALVTPMPVCIVAAYDKDGKPNAMNAAWGINSGNDEVALFISKPHKTTKNILETKAFTVSIADAANVVPADYVGIDTGNKVENKFEKSGLHETKSKIVNAPVIEEFPLVMECELEEVIDTEHTFAIIGKVLNTQVEESVLGDDGKVDITKLNAISFDTFHFGYYALGEKVAQAWDAGKPLV